MPCISEVRSSCSLKLIQSLHACQVGRGARHPRQADSDNIPSESGTESADPSRRAGRPSLLIFHCFEERPGQVSRKPWTTFQLILWCAPLNQNDQVRLQPQNGPTATSAGVYVHACTRSHCAFIHTWRPRRDERSTQQRGQRKQPWKVPPTGRQEMREADNGHDSGKKKMKKRALVCCNCGGKGHPARLCPTLSDHATQAVDEEGDTTSGNAHLMVRRRR